jgi:hypothetical protein
MEEVELTEENMVGDVEICGEQDLDKNLEFTLQQINVDFGLHAGIYIYATKDGSINASQVGLEQHCDIIKKAYLDWCLASQPEEKKKESDG